MNQDRINNIRNYYWANIMYGNLLADIEARLPDRARACIVEQMGYQQIEWLQSASYSQIEFKLIYEGFEKISNYTDLELLVKFIDTELYCNKSRSYDWFYMNIINSFSFKERMRLIEDRATFKLMTDMGLAEADELLEVVYI